MKQVKVGFIPLTDSAPLIVAKEEGFFEGQSLDVALIREVSWSNIRDKLIFRELDAAHMLAPMLMSTTLGMGTVKKPLVTAYSFGLNGNAISVSNALYEALSDYEPKLVLQPELSAQMVKRVIADRQKMGMTPLTFAVVFPYSMHHYLLRYWLASADIDVDEEINIVVLPPSNVVQALEENIIDGYCVGEPWNTHAVKKQVGVTLITGYEIWNNAPEKVLGVTQQWALENPGTHQKMIWALYQASQWIDRPENKEKLINYLSLPQYVGAPESSIENALHGEVCNPACTTCRTIPNFTLPFQYQANFPWQSHAVWILSQMKRWGQLQADVDEQKLASEIYLTDLYRQVLTEKGVSVPDFDYKKEGAHPKPWFCEGFELGEDAFIA